MNDRYLEKISSDRLPDVVLVKKVYGDKSLRNRKRKWRLKHMNEALAKGDSSSQADDYDAFLEDLEEDPELRQNVNIYRDPSKFQDGSEAGDMGDFPQIALCEMLEEMTIDDAIEVDREDDGKSLAMS